MNTIATTENATAAPAQDAGTKTIRRDRPVSRAASATRKTLELGCGPNPNPDFVNMDITDYGRNDIIVADLNTVTLPFPENEFDHVRAMMVLEHLVNLGHAIHEIHRVLKVGGTIDLTVPHYSGTDAWCDPTHIRGFTSQTMLFWTTANPSNYFAKNKKALFKVVTNEIRIAPTMPILDVIPKMLGPRLYDRLLAHIIPAQVIHVILEKI